MNSIRSLGFIHDIPTFTAKNKLFHGPAGRSNPFRRFFCLDLSLLLLALLVSTSLVRKGKA